MTRLTVQLFGPMSAKRADGTPVEFGYDKARALFAYLAAEQDREHPRGRLAALFWPESPEPAARHSLSQALSTVRRGIGDGSEPPLLVSQRDHVQLVTDDCWIDMLEVNRLIEETDGHDHSDPTGCTECLWRLQQAVELHRGPFLEGLTLPDSEGFEDWQRSVEQSTVRSLERVLELLIGGMERHGELDRACRFAERLLALDPWDEQAHRTLMRLLASAGRRADAIRQYETCREVLRRDLDLEPEPETDQLAGRIRAGLEGPTHFDPRPVDAPPSRPALPELTTSFVGRERETEELAALIDDNQSRLITLSGPGGIGKTRLAIEVAREKEHDFEDGACFISLTGLASPQLLASTILDALSVQLDPRADAREQLLAYLQPRRALLVLDNFEHLLESSLLLAEILEHAPGIRILATSRERLSLSGEWVYEVQGLSMPAGTDSAAIATSGAARLFFNRGRKHKASFLPRQEDAPAIVRICHLTGGMPLALELAAAWIPVLSPDAIADEIEQSLDFLHSTIRDLPARHQSVRAVLDRSWENMTDVEQRAFRRLSVFRGGFSRAAAEYVTGASLSVLSALVSKSLLHRDAEGRYQIHELLRQYGESRLLEDPGEVDVVRNRHRDYFIGFLAIREAQLEGRGQESALAEITAEIENLRAAWNQSVQTGDVQGLNRAVHSLWLYYETTGRYREGAGTMEEAFQAVRALEQIPEDRLTEHQLAISRLWARKAAISFRLSGPTEFRNVALQTIPMVRELDEPAELGIQLNYLATAAHVLGEWADEERALLESIELFERANRPWGVAYSKNDLGHLRALQGNLLEARSLHQEALQILEELGDRRGVAFALRNLGLVASQLEDTDLALALLRRSIEVRRPIGNQWGIAESLNQIGVILRESGQPEAAGDHFREALQLAREIRAMQLAAEILKEYLPLISLDDRDVAMAPHVASLIQRAGAATDAMGPTIAVNSADFDELVRVVDLVLDGSLDEAPVTPHTSGR